MALLSHKTTQCRIIGAPRNYQERQLFYYDSYYILCVGFDLYFMFL